MIHKNHQRYIEVWADWLITTEPSLVGTLRPMLSRGKEIFSFEYNDTWLKSTKSCALDPTLKLFQGKQYPSQGQENFGIFLDSCPDRWGRFLMDRREAQLARVEGRKERKLLESDYLLGVYDEHRMGAIRFRTDPEGPFLDNNKMLASPPWTSLRELEQASLELEKKSAEKKPEYSKWLHILIAPGISLGGARPKASVIDKKNHLWIAKFPSGNDDINVGAWEMLAYKLALLAKITTAEATFQKFNSHHHTFLSKRFDRTASGKRIHFASAMTLLQHSDGHEASYLELAEFIMQQGANPTEDLEQLWRRIVFYICISNTDDHLRNHGFILESNGWRLSPAFDINPTATGFGLKLNISESDNSQDLKLAMDVASYFRVNSTNANKIIQEVLKAIKGWRSVATSLGLSTKEQKLMENAFRVAEQ